MYGSGIPIIGNKPKVMLIFCIWLNIKVIIIPVTMYFSTVFDVFIILFATVKLKTIKTLIKAKTPIRPKLFAYIGNIKSEYASGMYIGVFFKPVPVRPPVPIAIRLFSSCIPSLICQFNILSIL